MDEYSDLLKLIDQIYAMALDDHQVPSSLRSLSAFAGARGVYSVTADPRTGQVLAANSHDIDPHVEQQYVERFAAKDIRLQAAVDWPEGKLVTELDTTERKEFHCSELYCELLAPNDVPHILALWVQKGPEAASAISLQRSHRQGPFLERDKERFKHIVPHLLRAMQIRHLLQPVRRYADGFLGILNRLPFGIIFLDAAGRLIESSAAAEQLLRKEDAICCRQSQVHARSPADDVSLQRAIHRTLSVKAGQIQPGGTVSLKRISHGPCLRVLVAPIRIPWSILPTSPSCILIVLDPLRTTRPTLDVTKTTLRLTEAEALLANELFTGIRLREAADNLQLSINTCKSQLKAIYAKTGCNSHAELAKMLLMTSLIQQ